MTTNPTHVLLIPCEMLTMEEAAEIKAHLTERLPSWVDPVLLTGARGSATLIPYEDPTAPVLATIDDLRWPVTPNEST